MFVGSAHLHGLSLPLQVYCPPLTCHSSRQGLKCTNCDGADIGELNRTADEAEIAKTSLKKFADFVLDAANTLRSALVGWNKSLSNEIAPDGVTCNLIVPGRIQTSRVDQLDEAAAKRTGKALDEVRAGSRAAIPTGRYGHVEEFADMATFLCSNRAGYTTGSIVRCDGGAIKGV
ncbi:MAG: hypothetical protein CMH69_01570 [Nitratireductor sp.]|nr:hypothetical protein [Nitratireductor sp.]